MDEPEDPRRSAGHLQSDYGRDLAAFPRSKHWMLEVACIIQVRMEESCVNTAPRRSPRARCISRLPPAALQVAFLHMLEDSAGLLGDLLQQSQEGGVVVTVAGEGDRVDLDLRVDLSELVDLPEDGIVIGEIAVGQDVDELRVVAAGLLDAGDGIGVAGGDDVFEEASSAGEGVLPGRGVPGRSCGRAWRMTRSSGSGRR